MSDAESAWPIGQPQRYLSGRERDAAALLEAASRYASNLQGLTSGWLWRKPYDRGAGHSQFFNELYLLMNLIRAMDLPAGSTVLEVGSGPGWVTEILLALGHEVHALEPSGEMIDIARERVRHAIGHWRIEPAPACHFHREALEDCSLPDASVDAVLFHAALHHVIDERRGLAHCHRVLKPGGVLGVCEGAWQPGNAAYEAILDEEMARYGTLENPFTRDYLDHLLHELGFVDVQRFHSINGFIAEARGHEAVSALAQHHAHHTNNLIAFKPGGSRRWPRDSNAQTLAHIDLCAVEPIHPGRLVRVVLHVENRGETTWPADVSIPGYVTAGIRNDALGGAGFRELPRLPIPHAMRPGESAGMALLVALPADVTSERWFVDLVCEGEFWFSTRGTQAVPIQFMP